MYTASTREFYATKSSPRVSKSANPKPRSRRESSLSVRPNPETHNHFPQTRTEKIPKSYSLNVVRTTSPDAGGCTFCFTCLRSPPHRRGRESDISCVLCIRTQGSSALLTYVCSSSPSRFGSLVKLRKGGVKLRLSWGAKCEPAWDFVYIRILLAISGVALCSMGLLCVSWALPRKSTYERGWKGGV